jgi:hypothetical protein
MVVGFASEALGCSARCAAYQRLYADTNGTEDIPCTKTLRRMVNITVVKSLELHVHDAQHGRPHGDPVVVKTISDVMPRPSSGSEIVG